MAQIGTVLCQSVPVVRLRFDHCSTIVRPLFDNYSTTLRESFDNASTTFGILPKATRTAGEEDLSKSRINFGESPAVFYLSHILTLIKSL
jgi:hypothetical protein